MALSALERIKLAKELSTLMGRVKTAAVIEKITLAKEIAVVMEKLGLTGVKPLPAPEPQPEPDDNALPQVVRDFIEGKFTGATKEVFIARLREVGDYVGQGLTLDELKPPVIMWCEQSGFSLD